MKVVEAKHGVGGGGDGAGGGGDSPALTVLGRRSLDFGDRRSTSGGNAAFECNTPQAFLYEERHHQRCHHHHLDLPRDHDDLRGRDGFRDGGDGDRTMHHSDAADDVQEGFEFTWRSPFPSSSSTVKWTVPDGGRQRATTTETRTASAPQGTPARRNGPGGTSSVLGERYYEYGVYGGAPRPPPRSGSFVAAELRAVFVDDIALPSDSSRR